MLVPKICSVTAFFVSSGFNAAHSASARGPAWSPLAREQALACTAPWPSLAPPRRATVNTCPGEVSFGRLFDSLERQPQQQASRPSHRDDKGGDCDVDERDADKTCAPPRAAVGLEDLVRINHDALRRLSLCGR